MNARLGSFVCISLLLVMAVCAQAQGAVAPAAKKGPPTIAVLPFVGDATVTPEQLNFITGKFVSELISINAFTVLDRGKMDFILKEQGFQQSGACNSSGCKVQVGQLLGVDNLVSGNMVKFGPEYAFRIEYIDVGSGQIVKTVELTKEGDLYKVYKVVCSEGAQKLAEAIFGPKVIAPAPPVVATAPTVDLAPSPEPKPQAAAQVPADAIPSSPSKPMSTKRKWAMALWGTSLLGGGGGYYFNTVRVKRVDEYGNALTARNYADTKAAFDNAQSASTRRNISYGVSIGTLVAGTVLWFLPEGN